MVVFKVKISCYFGFLMGTHNTQLSYANGILYVVQFWEQAVKY